MALVPAPVLGRPTVGEAVRLRARFVAEPVRAAAARVELPGPDGRPSGTFTDVVFDPVPAEPGVVEGLFTPAVPDWHPWEVRTLEVPAVIERGRAFRVGPAIDGAEAPPPSGDPSEPLTDAQMAALLATIQTGA